MTSAATSTKCLIAQLPFANTIPRFAIDRNIAWRERDRRVISGFVYVLKTGRRRRDCPREYGLHTTMYNRFNVGARDIYDSGGLANTVTSKTVNGLPGDGSTVYVRLGIKNDGVWGSWRDYQYTACSDCSSGGGGGTFENTDSVRIEHPSGEQYLDESGESRPVLCDVDGDGRDELVIGFGPFPSDGGWIEIKDDAEAGYAQLALLNIDWDDYSTANGETFPARGDLDGDGKDEIAVGLGAGGEGRVKIFDDAGANFAVSTDTPDGDGWIQVPWEPYRTDVGGVHPAIGNLDDDDAEELVLGVGDSGLGRVQVLDDALSGFDPFADTPESDGTVRLAWDDYNQANGTIWPTVCDLDADGFGELVLGVGLGGEGKVQVLDSSDGFAPRIDTPLSDGFVATTWDDYNTDVGSTYPVCGDVDKDGLDELIIGLGRYDTSGWFEILDDLEHGLSFISRSRVDWSDVDGAAGLTRPTVGFIEVLP